MDDDYSAGLEKLADFSTTHLSLLTQFVLSGASGLEPETMQVQVDGKEISYGFNDSTEIVQIALSDAGGAGSIVDVSACHN